MVLKRTIKYHPEIDPNKQSLVSQEAYLKQIKKLLEAEKYMRSNCKKLIDKLQEAARPSQDWKKALEHLQRSIQSLSENRKVIDKLQEAATPSQDWNKALEHLHNCLKPSDEYKKALENLHLIRNVLIHHE